MVNKLQQREWDLEEIDYVSEMPNKNYTSSLEGSSNRCVYLYFLDTIIIHVYDNIYISHIIYRNYNLTTGKKPV